jgi:polysaccharide deacetylase 2 family uncharacterized protein YibQ
MPPKRPRSSKPAKKPAAGRSRPPNKQGRGSPPFGWRLHLVLLVTAILLVGLVWLARREERLPPAPVKPPVETGIDQAALAREQAEAFLAALPLSAGAITRDPAELPRHYRVRHRPPAAKAVEQLRQRLRQLAPPLVLSTPEDGVLAIADSQGRSLLTIQFLPASPPPKAVAPSPGKPGRVAIIMDDLGRGTEVARQLLAMGQPVTFAILPGEPHAAEVARMAHAAGREVMLHAPMEPQGYPVVDPGDDALLVSLSEEELRTQMLALLARVPHVAGANNHMGSRFTEDEPAMKVVMAVMRERGLFFVDSLTSSGSVGSETAQRAGVPVLRRDVFLDNVVEAGPIAREIKRLADKARSNGYAVGICHPYPETLQALRQTLPKLAKEGIVFVRVSELLRGGG